MNLSELFANHLKTTRERSKITIQNLCDALGYEDPVQYMVLEDPELSNPDLKTIQRLSDVFPELYLKGLFRKYQLLLDLK